MENNTNYNGKNTEVFFKHKSLFRYYETRTRVLYLF